VQYASGFHHQEVDVSKDAFISTVVDTPIPYVYPVRDFVTFVVVKFLVGHRGRDDFFDLDFRKSYLYLFCNFKSICK